MKKRIIKNMVEKTKTITEALIEWFMEEENDIHLNVKGGFKMPVNWQEELNALEKAKERNWFKPVAGTHKIKFLSEGEEYTTAWENAEGVKQEVDRVRFEIETDNKKFDWGVARGKTENSLWGQLVLVAANKGYIKDQEITLLVKGSGKETSYIVQEALPLMLPKEEKVG